MMEEWNLHSLSGLLWRALTIQQEWLTEPYAASDEDDVYILRTKPGFILDDSFWAVFQMFPFRICHVSYYGPERPEPNDNRMQETGIFEVRWSLYPVHLNTLSEVIHA